jgi:hypothetical protein
MLQAQVEHLRLKNIEKSDTNCRTDPATTLPGLRDVITLEAQMDSLRTKGFLRAYRPYSPPADVRARFLSVCARVLDQPVGESSVSLRAVRLDSTEVKFRVLSALAEEFNGHAVHSSRLHEINNLADALVFYEASQSQQGSKNYNCIILITKIGPRELDAFSIFYCVKIINFSQNFILMNKKIIRILSFQLFGIGIFPREFYPLVNDILLVPN